MAQRTSVPRFGDWGTNDQNFTSIFEKARAEKGSTGSVNHTSSSFNSFSSEQDGRDTSVETENLSFDRKSREPSPSPSRLSYPLSNACQKSSNKVNPRSPSSTSSSEQDRKSTSRELCDMSFDGKSQASSSSSPRLNPLSNRAYNRKDYEYIATFPLPLNRVYRANKNQRALEVSDVSLLSSCTNSLGGISATSCESSKEKEYPQTVNALMRSDVPDSPDRVQLSEWRPELVGGSIENKRSPLSPVRYRTNEEKRVHKATLPLPLNRGCRDNKSQGALEVSDVSILSSRTDSLRDISAAFCESSKEEYPQTVNAHTRSDVPYSPGRVQLSELDGGSIENKRSPLSPVRNQKNEEKRAHEASPLGPSQKIAGETAAQGKFRGLLASTTPAALPKFGDWNASKPYTQIFGQHRDEKLGVQPLSLQPLTNATTKCATSQRKQWRVCVLCFKASAVKE